MRETRRRITVALLLVILTGALATATLYRETGVDRASASYPAPTVQATSTARATVVGPTYTPPPIVCCEVPIPSATSTPVSYAAPNEFDALAPAIFAPYP